ncbi:MAG: diguanylate cyclase [Geminicoccaceae bacterium]
MSDAFRNWIASGGKAPFTLDLPFPDGKSACVELEAFGQEDEVQPEPCGVVEGLVRSVDRRRAEREKGKLQRDLFRQVIDSIPDPVFVQSRDEGWLFVNPAGCRLLEREPERDANGRIVGLRMSRSFAGINDHMTERVFTSGKAAVVEFAARDTSRMRGKLRSWSGMWAPLKDEGGDTLAVLMHHRDVTEQTSLQGRLIRERKKLAQLASTDPLTQLHNRRWFLDRAERELARLSASGLPLAIVLLDIDHFKSVNDNYGHPAGDAVLVAVAKMLREQIRTSDLCARWGGEEFILALPGADRNIAAERADEIRTHIARSQIPHEGTELVVTASFGVADIRESGAAFPLDADVESDKTGEITGLTGRADRALYEAKAAGRNCVIIATDTSERNDREPLVVIR